MEFTIDLKDEQWKYLKHAKIDGRVIVPTSVYLKLAWNVINYFKNSCEISLVYRNVRIHKHQVEIPENDKVVLVVMVQKGTWFSFVYKKLHTKKFKSVLKTHFLLFLGSGNFEITNNKILLCSGVLQASDSPNLECIQLPKKAVENENNLNESDVYNVLETRGLQYSGPFRTICSSSANGYNGILLWKDDWIPFLEGMIQMYTLRNNVRRAQVPVKITKIIVNLKLHEESVNKSIGTHCIFYTLICSLPVLFLS